MRLPMTIKGVQTFLVGALQSFLRRQQFRRSGAAFQSSRDSVSDFGGLFFRDRSFSGKGFALRAIHNEGSLPQPTMGEPFW
jgi:hypothetical protein